MAKLLRIRDRLLLGLSLAGDLFDEVRSVSGVVPNAYRQVYGFAPSKYKKHNLYVTVHRMLKSELIERVVVDGEPRFRLSSKGKKKMIREFPLIYFQNRKWDKRWRILVFDIPEKSRNVRDTFRNKLRELGFSRLQDSVWISPHPIEEDVREYVKANDLEDFVFLFVSDRMAAGDTRKLVEEIWKIEDLNRSYKELIDKYKRDVLVGRQFTDCYYKLLMIDPFLPRELLPRPWYGDEARKVFKEGGWRKNKEVKMSEEDITK